MSKRKFKSESAKLLDLMINSIYTHKEIFLRELISNASDAIDKLYFISLKDESVVFNRDDFYITIEADKKDRKLINTTRKKHPVATAGTARSFNPAVEVVHAVADARKSKNKSTASAVLFFTGVSNENVTKKSRYFSWDFSSSLVSSSFLFSEFRLTFFVLVISRGFFKMVNLLMRA